MHIDMLAAGNRLKAFRETTDLKSWQFAQALEMDGASLHRYLRGESLLGAVKLILLYMMGCNIVWYLTGEGSMYADNDAGRELAAKFIFRSVEK